MKELKIGEKTFTLPEVDISCEVIAKREGDFVVEVRFRGISTQEGAVAISEFMKHLLEPYITVMLERDLPPTILHS